MTRTIRTAGPGRWVAGIMLLSIAFALMVAPTVHAGQGQQRPVLGVGVAALEFSQLDDMSLPYGVTVVEVIPGSPADRAGFEAGDIITAVGGQAVFSPERLRWLTEQARGEEEITVAVTRDGAGGEVRVDLSAPGSGHGQEATVSARRSFIGIRMQRMSAVMREAFGAPSESGVLVADILEDGPAAKAGLEAGDVIVSLASKAVAGPADVYRALDYFDPGEAVSISVYRGKEQRNMVLTLGSPPAPAAGMPRPGYREGSRQPMMPHHHPHEQPHGMHGEGCPSKMHKGKGNST